MANFNFWSEIQGRLNKTYKEKIDSSNAGDCSEELDSVEFLETEFKIDGLTDPVYEEKLITDEEYLNSSYRNGILEGEIFLKRKFSSKNQKIDLFEARMRQKWDRQSHEFCIGYCSAVCRGLIVNVLKSRRVDSMNIVVPEVVVQIEYSIFKALNLWVQKGNYEKRIFGFVQNVLYSDFEDFLKPIAGSYYERKKYAENLNKENPVEMLGGFKGNYSFPTTMENDFSEDSNDPHHLSRIAFNESCEEETEKDLSESRSSEFVNDLRGRLEKSSPDLLESFDIYSRIVMNSTSDRGIFLEYAKKMRADADDVSNNTLTNWGKYEIEKKLKPRINSIIKNSKKEEF